MRALVGASRFMATVDAALAVDVIQLGAEPATPELHQTKHLDRRQHSEHGRGEVQPEIPELAGLPRSCSGRYGRILPTLGIATPH